MNLKKWSRIILSAVMVVVLGFSLIACGPDGGKDNKAPVVSITMPYQINALPNSEIQVLFTVQDETPVKDLKITIEVKYKDETNVSVDSQNKFKCQGDGKYTIKITAEDKGGKSGSSTHIMYVGDAPAKVDIASNVGTLNRTVFDYTITDTSDNVDIQIEVRDPSGKIVKSEINRNEQIGIFMPETTGVHSVKITTNNVAGSYVTTKNIIVQSDKEHESTPFTVASQTMDGLFNPFFSTSAYDSMVHGQTQIAMLSTDKDGNIYVGEDEPTVVKAYNLVTTDERTSEEKKSDERVDIERYNTVYRFVIKKGIKFSDGEDLTIKDILFNMYTYLDPSYIGSSTMYSIDIEGLDAYRTQNPLASEGSQDALNNQFVIAARTRVSNLINYVISGVVTGKPELTTEEQLEVLKNDLKKVKELYYEEVTSDWNNCANGIEGYIEEYTDKNTGKKWVTEVWQAFLITQNLVKVEYNQDDSIKSVDYASYADTAVGKEGEELKDAFINLVYEGRLGDDIIDKNINDILKYYQTAGNAMTEFAQDEKSEYFKNLGRKVDNISGIRTETLRTGEKFNFTDVNNTTHEVSYEEDHEVLYVRIYGVDPKAIYNFSFGVAPMHYYSNPKSGSGYKPEDGYLGYNGINHFGIKFGDNNYMNKVLRDSEINRLPLGGGIYQVSNISGEEDQSKVEGTGGSGFYNNGTVYYVRNKYFYTTGDFMANAKIKYFRYTELQSNRLLDAVATEQVHFSDPSAEVNTINEIEDKYSDTLGYELIENNGYGYIGINAKFVPDLEIRQAIMYSIDVGMILDYYSELATLIYRPMSAISWAYPQDIKTPYYFATNDGENFSRDRAISIIKKLVADAGYQDSSNGKAKSRMINGRPHSLKYAITIAGAETDHPAYSALMEASSILNECGFDTKVVTNVNALSELAKGGLTIWAAAWQSTIDPDMYQVYHKDSTATATLNWGYKTMLGLDGNEDYANQEFKEEQGYIDELSQLIEDARATTDQELRKPIYREALDLVMQLAVELPTYNRKNLYVYRKDKINVNTMVHKEDLTAYQGLLNAQWKIEFVL